MSDLKQIKEVVAYRIKPDQVEAFVDQGINEMRQFIADSEGSGTYQNYQSIKDPSVFVDLIEWDALESAMNAAKVMDQRMKEGNLSGLTSAFEKIEFSGHFKLVS